MPDNEEQTYFADLPMVRMPVRYPKGGSFFDEVAQDPEWETAHDGEADTAWLRNWKGE